ncbi:MAG TPA: SOS response-associated peptidase [Candidatus Saccharimonadales bacterium]|jgi:putative SOS response-associated peptidase YedK|nr:SOS response-associated peptidase [Candidatus Saccharimonadales bacterium]
MCGRYRLTATERYIAEHFNLDAEPVWPARYNIAPGQPALVVRQAPKSPLRESSLLRWGLVPYWAKGPSIGYRTINARSEAAAEKPAFREALKQRRCLVPTDGFYEWQKLGPKDKQPYNIGLKDNGLFAFAGLWESWRDPADKSPGAVPLETFTILTTSANPLVAAVHDRMPVILAPEDYDLWLDPGTTDPARVVELLRPFDARLMKTYPVSKRVNKVENDAPECSQEIELLEKEEAQLGLFS